MTEQATARTWTCARCQMTTSWMDGVQRPALPANWIERDGEAFCLACRRDLAAEAGLAGAEDAPLADRRRLSAAARLEFELRRNPECADGKVAHACSTSVAAVRKARERLGLQGRPQL